MSEIAVCREEELAVGEFRPVQAGEEKLLLFRLEDGFHATQMRCSHLFASLAKGDLVEGHQIRCPLHRARFDVRDGSVVEWACFPPGIGLLNGLRGSKPLATWPVQVRDGIVHVLLSESRA